LKDVRSKEKIRWRLPLCGNLQGLLLVVRPGRTLDFDGVAFNI